MPDNQETQDPTTIFGSVFYIHPSDTSNVKLVNELFNGHGYADWKRSIVLGLSSKNKLSFVDGSLPKPAANDSTYKAWCRCNDPVLSWLLFSLDKNIAKSVWFCKTAREV